MEDYQEALKRFLGLPPYDADTNISKGDPYVAISIKRRYRVSEEKFARDCHDLRIQTFGRGRP